MITPAVKETLQQRDHQQIRREKIARKQSAPERGDIKIRYVCSLDIRLYKTEKHTVCNKNLSV